MLVNGGGFNGNDTQLMLGNGQFMDLTATAISSTPITLQRTKRVYKLTASNSTFTLNAGLYDGQEIIIFSSAVTAYAATSTKVRITSMRKGDGKESNVEITLNCRFLHLVWDSVNTCWMNTSYGGGLQ